MISRSEKQTIALGKRIAKTLKGGEIIALIGNLGTGKTTLIKGIAAGLDIKKTIVSPTFLLMRVYNVANRKSQIAKKRHTIRQLVHIDCYRIDSPDEIEAIGAVEYFGQNDSVVVIEWAEKIKKILCLQKGEQASQIKKIMISLGNKPNIRKITIQ